MANQTDETGSTRVNAALNLIVQTVLRTVRRIIDDLLMAHEKASNPHPTYRVRAKTVDNTKNGQANTFIFPNGAITSIVDGTVTLNGVGGVRVTDTTDEPTAPTDFDVATSRLTFNQSLLSDYSDGVAVTPMIAVSDGAAIPVEGNAQTLIFPAGSIAIDPATNTATITGLGGGVRVSDQLSPIDFDEQTNHLAFPTSSLMEYEGTVSIVPRIEVGGYDENNEWVSLLVERIDFLDALVVDYEDGTVGIEGLGGGGLLISGGGITTPATAVHIQIEGMTVTDMGDGVYKITSGAGEVAFHFERNGAQRYIARNAVTLGDVAQAGGGTVTWEKNGAAATLPVTLAAGDVLSAILSSAAEPASTAVTLRAL